MACTQDEAKRRLLEHGRVLRNNNNNSTMQPRQRAATSRRGNNLTALRRQPTDGDQQQQHERFSLRHRSNAATAAAAPAAAEAFNEDEERKRRKRLERTEARKWKESVGERRRGAPARKRSRRTKNEVANGEEQKVKGIKGKDKGCAVVDHPMKTNRERIEKQW